ncbi:MAG: secondary thiamine-phosphate synthase enzyme YjbQ [bacterium]
MAQQITTLETNGPGLYEFTTRAEDFVVHSKQEQGLLTIFVQHTSCSITIQENADPDVIADLQEFFHRLVPPSDTPSMSWITHRNEGPDDMPAHIKSALTQTSLSIPIHAGRLTLGTWQGLYLFEHRRAAHSRKLVLHISD